MKTVYVVTMWSGGQPAKKWHTEEKPETLANGMGVEFVNAATQLSVRLIGSISVEEYESGLEELELGLGIEGSGPRIERREYARDVGPPAEASRDDFQDTAFRPEDLGPPRAPNIRRFDRRE